MFFEFRKGQQLRKKKLGDEDKWYGTQNDEPEGKWNITADVMVDNFKER